MSTHANDPEQLARELEELRAALSERDEKIEHLVRQVEILRKIAFGRSSEKRTPEVVDARQRTLFDSLLAEANEVARQTGAEGEVAAKQGARPKRKARRRKKWPDHVPRFRTTYELPESERECTD